MASHPGFIPSFVDPAEVLKDRTLLAGTRDIVRELKTLARSAEDTITLLSHEVYVADLAYYESVKSDMCFNLWAWPPSLVPRWY